MRNNVFLFCLVIVYSFVFATNFQLLHSEVKILKVEINPLNRVMIFCSEKPTSFSSDLSADKSKITIKIEKGNAVESAREIHGQGIIQDVYIQNFKNFAQISIILKEKRGYNANFLPFSQSLMIEVFDWAKLSTGEDDYRSGLLSFENDLMSSAKKYFTKSLKSGNSTSAGFLGFIYLKEGRIDEALDNLLIAEKFNANIPDFYAALSQIYSIKNNKQLAEKYRKDFSQKSGLAIFTTMNVPSAPETKNEKKQSISFLDKMNDPEFIDSSQIAQLDSIKINRGSDSANKPTNKKQDTITRKILGDVEKNPPTAMPSWLSKTAFYVAFASLLFIIMLFSIYLRWRKAQLKKIQKETTRKFSEKLKNAQTSMSGSAHAAKIYQKTEKVADGSNISEPNLKKPTKQMIANKQAQEDKAEKVQDLQKMALEIIANKANEFENVKPDNSLNIDDTSSNIQHQTEKSSNPRLELAMHLHDEQMKLKTKNIESIKNNEIPTDQKKLSEVAKKLGIEKSSLETKRKISDLESDKKSLSRLAEKFNKGKD